MAGLGTGIWEEWVQNLDEFQRQLEELIGRPTNTRPFVCEGSPLKCGVFIVGFNPATEMTATFWDFWRSGYGFDKKAWFKAYKKDRISRPLKPGKKRRNAVSNTRRVIDWIAEAASPCDCLETNIYSLPSDDKSGLAQESRNIAPFKLLLKCIKPSVIVAHGQDAGLAVQRLAPSSYVRCVEHFSRKWSEASARALGEGLKVHVDDLAWPPS